MSTEEKEVRYRASKLVEQRGISYDEALVVAAQELAEQVTTLKQARRNVFAEKGKRVQQAPQVSVRKCNAGHNERT